METLTCSVMTYAWGKIGSESLVACLAKNNNNRFTIDQQQHYAELWMGAHPNAPSLVNGSHQNQNLDEWIENHPEFLGGDGKLGPTFPFLFKILSVNKALSIQAHPDKLLAEKLHTARPDVYKDSNHKPEMVLPLTPFEALCGFRSVEQIGNSISAVPELRMLIGAELADRFIDLSTDGAATDDCRQALKDCYKSLMKVDDVHVCEQLRRLIQRLQQSGGLNDPGLTDTQVDLLIRLNSQYPGDRGCFSVFFFNYFLLQPGQALFLGPNEPHAYLSGDCLECMASSDNVVRAGLTHKFIDVDTLVEMLTYRTGQTELLKSTRSQSDPYVEHFIPPVEEFAVAKIDITHDYHLSIESSISILLVVSGEGVATCKYNSTSDDSSLCREQLYPGSVILLSADSHVLVKPHVNGLHMYRAYCNSSSQSV